MHAGSCWLVMDYHGRASLASLLRNGRRRLPPAQTAALGLQLLAALRAVHAAGLVHCDVKPANLLLGADGRLVLVDFGIAETIDGGPAHPARRTGHILGTPAYMAPELVRGEAPRPAADLWSLGATLYTVVEGRLPFAYAEAAPTLAAVLHDPPEPADGPAACNRCWRCSLIRTPPGDPPTTRSKPCSSTPSRPGPPPSSPSAAALRGQWQRDRKPPGRPRPLPDGHTARRAPCRAPACPWTWPHDSRKRPLAQLTGLAGRPGPARSNVTGFKGAAVKCRRRRARCSREDEERLVLPLVNVGGGSAPVANTLSIRSKAPAVCSALAPDGSVGHRRAAARGLAPVDARRLGDTLWAVRGISARTVVPTPIGLMTCKWPLSASTRSAIPLSPEPAARSAPPTPSSVTSTRVQSPAWSTVTVMWEAAAYLATLVIASAMM